MRVSVAMCTYNGERYLQEQLHSILEQSRQPDELVVCEDASSDGTLNILHSFKRLAPFDVRVYANDSNLGYVKNFEKAISKCEGDIILCSDQDDIWFPDRIERSIATFSEEPECGYIFSDARLIDEESKQLMEKLWNRVGFPIERRRGFEDPEKQPNMLYVKNMVTGATMAFRSKYRDMFLPIPELSNVIHDGWIALTLSLFGKFGVALKEPLIYYRIHSQQQIGARRRGVLRGLLPRLPKMFMDPRLGINRDRSDLFAVQSHIETSGSTAAMRRFERTLGRMISNLESRLCILGLKSRLRRVMPILSLYKKGVYARYPSPFLMAFRDVLY